MAVAVSAIGLSLSGCTMFETKPLSADAQVQLTATEAVEAIRTGRLSAVEYVETLSARAERLAALNSLIVLDKTGAMAAAKRIDELRARGAALPALAGLPIVVKDNINTKDLPTTGATPALAHVQPMENAPTLQRLVDAGAIVLGKANMHELAFGATNTNLTSFAGIAHNPYDTSRVPGGSSGGTGAAVAARIAPAGLGTDTGGSVRIPAALCGLAGLRPSVGNGLAQRRYDGSGVLPISHTRDTIGPMARTVEDVILLDSVMSGRTAPAPTPLKGLKLGVPASLWANADPQVTAVMHAAIEKLKAAGVVLVDADVGGLRELTDKAAGPIALHEAREDIPAYLNATGVQGISLQDIEAHVASPDVKAAMKAVVGDVAGGAYPAAIGKYRPAMQKLYASYFARNGVAAMVFPTVVIPAPVIDAEHGSGKISVKGGGPVDTFATLIRNTDPGSTAGIPGLTLPAGLTQSGLPVGLALDGPLGSDGELLGIGLSIEKVLGVPPPPQL